MAHQKALVICPGRGVYNKTELGYLNKFHGDKKELISSFDAIRTTEEQDAISALDNAERFSVSKFTRGDNASGLIYACSYADFQSIDRKKYDIVGVTGNSMGWYTALACSGALSAQDGFHVVNTMGRIMQGNAIGGQILYPFNDENWIESPAKKSELESLASDIEGLYISIYLGGMIVFAGTDTALKTLEDRLPAQGRFPMRLMNHSGFHSELQSENSIQGKAALPETLFSQPNIPLIDGRGHLWHPQTVELGDLWNYTFGKQVTETYDFTKAVANSVKELAPDIVIVLGPGTTLGGATAQALISCGWESLNTKKDFTDRQENAPYLAAMGLETQRKWVI
ncbi:ACP S-malonyltransferase [Hellea balneolensis]|uniref:ACP S-malonyltransferase n=1 Tax=Hellea balneolensis TaxID=287478 RepID=UPI0003FECAAD|nr:ACP S-malonyltransferase [Hellea balneolensis]